MSEDFQNGGDRDFNDGDYLEISQGRGEALSTEEVVEVASDIRETETPLEPETRQDEIVETSLARSLTEVETSVEENKTWGGVESPNTVATRLGHAAGMQTEEGQQLVYNRYSNESEVRLGSDGLGRNRAAITAGKKSQRVANAALWQPGFRPFSRRQRGRD